ncbi:hypothetical protein Ccrd_019985 [Cynara cardunculus var. scolymus]|uniref:Uncharacterized protein n=1 Tax=Cynara cardunculus var. scolymus TaxID=59895 RepID=A0A103Y3B0_CYNCS|nr:hypothetical protein Ccrd_019985 [Cynara cardunculus var. scolymus]
MKLASKHASYPHAWWWPSPAKKDRYRVTLFSSEAYLGRVINALAKPIDGRGEISSSEYRLIESVARGIISRHSMYEPLQTGLIAIDSMISIGCGQQELISGDIQTEISSKSLAWLSDP